jgi:hypothetical protein
METPQLEAIEIYPNILVYKNMFKDISKSYKILTDSLVESEDRLFSPWTKWSIFGEYLSPMIPNFSLGDRHAGIENIKTTTETQEDQKNFALEMMKNFHLVTEDYIKRYGIDVDPDALCLDESGKQTKEWIWTGGTIGKYYISDESEQHGMRYHSDYQREKGDSPGYKFVITCTIYFNDDYEGGEVDFAMGDKLVKYKPEAGDLLVFPSGHPEYLTEGGEPYLHGVMPSYKKNKFLARMYWQKYQKGTDEWYAKEKEFGKEVWASMQPELEKDFLIKNPQRNEIKGAKRIT